MQAKHSYTQKNSIDERDHTEVIISIYLKSSQFIYNIPYNVNAIYNIIILHESYNDKKFYMFNTGIIIFKYLQSLS